MERTMSASAYNIAKRHEILKATLFEGLVETNAVKSLRCDVVFGSPSVGCRGTGICKLNANGIRRATELKQTCRGTSALLLPIDGGKGVSMILPRELMCVNIVRNHLRNNVLNMPESCRIPAVIASALGLQIKYLPSGTYPVIQSDGFFRIDFK